MAGVPDACSWVETNGQRYLEVRAGNPFTRGLLTGEALAKQVKRLKLLIEEFVVRFARRRLTYKRLVEMARPYERYFPHELVEEMRGIAEGTPDKISYDDVLLQNCIMDIVYGHLVPGDIEDDRLELFNWGCTSFGVVDPGGGPPLLAQNFDYAPGFGSAAAFVLLELPGGREVFTLRIGAMLNVPSGGNSSGVMVTVNAIKGRVPGVISSPLTARTRECLSTCGTAAEFVGVVERQARTACANLLVADSRDLLALEVTPNRVVKRDVRRDYHGVVARSNTFVSDDLQDVLVSKSYSKVRQYYALGRLEQARQNRGGVVTDEDLLEILADEPIICRKNRLRSHTIGFVTRKYFGLGNAHDNPPGANPLHHGVNGGMS
ncbi:MAG: C45 family autoproteolytic acyltransferase/hydrolase [Promethearchaeota archaeon]